MKLSDFLESTNIPAPVVRAVVRRLGGWKDAQGDLLEIASHGADSGWAGFIYYKDTVAFFRAHRADIIAMLKEDEADNIGHGDIAAYAANFRCLADVGSDAIARTLYGRFDWDNEAAVTTANGLAWYALEAVANAYYGVAE